ncbi:MAG: hypothetical protein DDT33_01522 [Firmicutes bacterium]|nr:hypothetical protein [Bacillota bacterium]
MKEKEFSHKSCQQLYGLYLEYKDKLGRGVSMNSMMWKAIGPSVPELIATIDEDEALLAKIRDFTKQLLEAMEADIGEQTIEN